jgi:TRAP-type C4-dicarboxylate transport system substrate-binding protein
MYKKVLIAAAGLMLLQTSGTQAADPIKVASFVSPKSSGVREVIKPWMARVKAEIGNKVELKGYWGGSLGKSPVKQYELVKNGVADLAWILPSYTSGQFPEMQITELPFLLNNGVEASLTIQRLHDAGYKTGFDGIKMIGAWATEPNVLFMRKPVKSISDLKNLKIRSAGAVGGHWLGQIGAIPQTMSAPKATIALNRKTIDGMQQGWTGMRTFKARGLVTHVMDLPLGAIPFFLGMNKKRWDGLSKDVQAAFMKAGGEQISRAGGAAYSRATKSIRSSNKQAQKLIVVKPSAAELKKITATAKKSVHDWWIKKTKNGQAVYDKTLSILANVRKNG